MKRLHLALPKLPRWMLGLTWTPQL